MNSFNLEDGIESIDLVKRAIQDSKRLEKMEIDVNLIEGEKIREKWK